MVEPPVSYSYLESTVPAAACEVAISVRSAGRTCSTRRMRSLRLRSASCAISSGLPPLWEENRLESLFLSVTGSSFTIFFSSIAGLELDSLHFSPAGFATEYVYRHWFVNRIADCIGYRPCFAT
jgi:hypothetical protein